MLVVQKFGGSSVASLSHMRRVVKRILETRKKYTVNGQPPQLVVIVSAMGDETDMLVDLAHRACRRPDPRELDMLLSTGEQKSIAILAMMLKARGLEARSLLGGQAGIYTDGEHTHARITRMEPYEYAQAVRRLKAEGVPPEKWPPKDRIRRELDQGRIVVVAGFQGVTDDEDREITTLGRGGSDLTAVALAAALEADFCEIYTDVEGVYTADPTLIPHARKLDSISFEEMLELASAGAQVMQARSIEFARNYGVRIHVRSSLTSTEGTWIVPEEEIVEKAVYRAVALSTDEAKLSILGVPDVPGIAARIFGRLAEAGIVVDMIIQSAARRGINDISFTVAKSDFERAKEILEELAQELSAERVDGDPHIAKVSIVGSGMRTRPGIAAQMFRALAQQNINIELISTSEIKISCVIREDEAEKAVRAIHDAFDLAHLGVVEERLKE